MSSQTTNYQCPSCMGPLHFDSEIGKLKCDYCGSEYTTEEIEELFSQKNEQAEQAFEEEKKKEEQEEGWDDPFRQSDWGEEAETLKVYSCTSCGAELICEQTTAATCCPYCGNPAVIPGQFAGALKPEYIIPFKIGKEQALAALRKHYGGKRLLPKLFSEENHIEKVQGVYVPFWLYDGVAHADALYSGEIIHRRVVRDEDITTITYYDLKRQGNVSFEKIPVDASKRMDDALMDSIEPYFYQDLKPFSLSYLPGYLADKYDVTAKECSDRASRRAVSTTADAVRRTTAGYANVTTKTEKVHFDREKVHYALFPVWILNTTWNGGHYIFAMNGQTGKIVGDLPEDPALCRKWHLIYTAIFAVILYILNWILAFM